MDITTAYTGLFIFSLAVLGIVIAFCFVRAILGPSIPDRIVSINMIGTAVIIIVCILAIFLKEDYLVDIGLIYAMISFLAVVVITKVYMGAHEEAKHSEEEIEAAEKEEVDE